MSQLLPYETIVKASEGDPEAVAAVLSHYAGYIRSCAKIDGHINTDMQEHIVRQVSNIFENSDFVYMLNQANGDRQILAKQLNISPHQLSYVTHSGEGEGLLFFGNVILPFVDHFPKDLELYRILTTRLSEVVEAKHE